MIFVLDNYDSFTYNLVQLVGKYSPDIVVKRNNKISVEEVRTMKPDGIIISPGPGRPERVGITEQLIRQIGTDIPLLGVCLGHQAIGSVFGASVTYAPSLVHGKATPIVHSGSALFSQIPNPFLAGRYHSLVVSRDGFPDELRITASTKDGIIMALEHRNYPIIGVQFHPESILTPVGEQIIRNWLKGVVKDERTS
ncbi:MAG: aminodeoxychorismate/anthranilate synthase component II [bacterium]